MVETCISPARRRRLSTRDNGLTPDSDVARAEDILDVSRISSGGSPRARVESIQVVSTVFGLNTHTHARARRERKNSARNCSRNCLAHRLTLRGASCALLNDKFDQGCTAARDATKICNVRIRWTWRVDADAALLLVSRLSCDTQCSRRRRRRVGAYRQRTSLGPQKKRRNDRPRRRTRICGRESSGDDVAESAS